MYTKLLSAPGSDKPDLLVHGEAEENAARADGYTVEIPAPATPPTEPPPGPSAPTYDPPATEPVAVAPMCRQFQIMPALKITAVIGARFAKKAKMTEQSVPIRWHDRVISILERLGQPTDGSMLMLQPGTAMPFYPLEEPYDDLVDGARVHIVPNAPEEAGEGVEPTKGLPVVTVAAAE